MRAPNITPEHFEEMYARDPDPWNFASSEYEQGRYRATVAALGDRRYARAFEPGCSVGVLTARLATICDDVEAMDLSPSAIAEAEKRCHLLRNVHLTCGSLTEQAFGPQGMFDLIVLSEIGYYFEERQLRIIAERLIQKLSPGGTLLAVHWLGESPDHPLSGDRVHEILGRIAGLNSIKAERHEGFRLEVWERT